MPIRAVLLALFISTLVAACGGEAPSSPQVQSRLLATAAVVDPIAFTGVLADYRITEKDQGYLVTALADGAETPVPRNARLRFADTSLGFDLDGAPGQAYRLYRTAFDRAPDAAGLGYWVGLIDRGVDLVTVADGFTGSAEFKALYGSNPSSLEYVSKLYLHLLHRPGDPAGIAYWTGVLDRNVATRGQVLAAFAENVEGKAAVADAIRTGVSFLETDVAYIPAAHPGAMQIVDLHARAVLDGSASTVTVGRNILYYWTLSKKPQGSAATLAGERSALASFVADV